MTTAELLKLEPEYIGDAVYATHDGYHVWLWTERDGRWESIALEPEVFGKLVAYQARLTKEVTA